MRFHEFGHDLVLAEELGFELFDLVVLGVLDGLALAAVGEGEMAVLEELLEPVVELVGVEVEFIAEVGDGDLVDEVPFEDGDLLGARRNDDAACSWWNLRSGYANPNGAFFQIRLRQNKTKWRKSFLFLHKETGRHGLLGRAGIKVESRSGRWGRWRHVRVSRLPLGAQNRTP